MAKRQRLFVNFMFMSRQKRILALLSGVFLLALLGLAAMLTPDSSGMGTHRQLGLAPCSMRLIFGVPCPACGMTTSWCHFGRGEWLSSWSANPAGFLLAMICVFASGGLVRMAISGRIVSLRVQWGFVASLIAVGCVAMGTWLVDLLRAMS